MMKTCSHRWMRVTLLASALLISPLLTSSVAIDDDSVEELIKQAEDLFKEELYVEAFPLFSQLLSVYPENINYNFKFSVCVLFADENKGSAIALLEKVTANLNADQKAYYYLGYAYHLNYQFKKAITAYNQFKNSASKKDLAALPVERRVQMCENGLTLLRNKTELGVLSKTEIKETEYFRTYDMELLTGKILVKPDDFKTPNDIERNEESLVYLGKNAKRLFFSSYGKSGDNRDLYMVLKKSDGAWGMAERLPDYINSAYDENFPVMHPKKNILYFSSNGHNSMGGYDIFKARYDSSTSRWSKPVNLDFAINSADDDILYLPTADERTAFFSSKRSSIQGKISVYKVMLKEPPGRFAPDGEPDMAVTDESVELLSIDEILEEAKLDVNAKAEDFAEVSSSSPATESQTPESMEAETFTELTDEQMVNIGFEYAEKIKKDELRLKNEAEAAFETARNKKEQSTTKAKEAEAIRSRLDNIADARQKETASQKADILDKESEKLLKQAKVSFEIAKSLTSEAERRERQSTTAFTTAEKIKTATTSSPKGEAIPLLIEQKVLAQSIENDPGGISQRAEEMEREAEVKEEQAGEAYEKIQFMENEITEIDTDIKNLIEQAERTKDPVIKEEILSQAQELEAEKKDTEDDLEKTYVEARLLDAEATSLRKEADFQEELSSEILSSSKTVEVAATETSPTETDAESDAVTSADIDISTQTIPETSTTESAYEQPLVSVVSETEPDISISETDAEVSVTVDASTTVNAADPPAEEIAEETTIAASPEESFEINEETIEAAVINKETIVDEILAVEKLESEAASYDEEAKDIREKAESADPAFRESALEEAEKFEIAAAQKRNKASEGKALINSYSFRTNVAQYDDLTSNSTYLTPEDLNEAKSQQEESVAEFEKAQELRKAAATIEDPNDKALALREAEKLEVEALASQKRVNNSLSYRENKGEIAQQTKSEETMDSEKVQELSKYHEESANLYNQARLIRIFATTNDPEEKEAAFLTAAALEQQALEKQQTAINLHELYKYEGVLFEAVKVARPMSAQEQESLDALSTEYNGLSEEKKTVRANAETLEDPAEIAAELRRANDLESQALDKQREALNIYFESDAEVAALLGEKPASESSLASSNTGDESSTGASDPLVSTEPAPPTTDSSPTDSESARTASNITTSNTTTSTSSQPGTVSASTPATTIASSDPRTADELVSDSEANRKEAKRIYESIETIDDPEEMMAALDKAEQLETQADAEMARAKQLGPGNETVLADASANTSETATSQPQTDPSTTRSDNSSPQDETDVTVGGVPLEDASSEEILAAVMNDEVESTTALRTEPTPSTTAIDDAQFIVNEPETNEIEYVEPPDNSSNTTTFEETATTNTTGNVSEMTSPEETFTTLTSEAVTMLSLDEPLEADIFAVEEMVPYTPSNPIPVNPIIPSGLLFKVQVGAFRNPIPQDLFKGINPIMGEKTDMGFIRYSAGLFSQISSANEAKGVIQGMGYDDAFVVAFYNGARVSIADARRMLEDGTVPQPIVSAGSTFRTSSGTSATSVPGTIDIGTIDELFYTVQVGVYSRPTNLGEKFNLNDLYTLRTSNGYIRYNHGKFNSFNEASNRKEVVIEKGIADAFVTAYLNGKRISVEQARSMPERAGTPDPSNPDNVPADISMDNDDRLEKGEQLEAEKKDTEDDLEKTYVEARLLDAESDAVTSADVDISTQTIPETSTTEPDISTSETGTEVSATVYTSTTVNAADPPVEDIAEETTVATSPEEAFEINEETIESAVINKETMVDEILVVEKLEREAASYDEKAKDIREKAESADPAFTESALVEAEKFEIAAAQKRNKASEGKSLINSYSFRTNVLQYEDLTSNSTYLTPEDLDEVKSDQEESVAKFEKAQELRKTAATIEDPKDKALALQEAEKLEVEALASQKQVNNSLRYLENNREIAQQTKSEGTMDSEKVQVLNNYHEEADNLYTQARFIRIFATTNDLEEQAAAYRTADALEQQALETQQTAINLHELYKTDVSVEVPAGDARYMVKIGEFGKDVPVDEATTFFSIKDLGIEVHNIDDKAIYTVGEFIRYEDAKELRIVVESEGIENSSVVVFQDGIILSVEEYLKNTLDSDTE